MSFKQKLAAWLNEQSDEPEAGAQTLIIKTEAPAVAPGAEQPAPPAAQESEEVTRLRAENKQLRTAQLEQRKATLKAEAEGFINEKIRLCEVLPAVAEGFIASYVRAGVDDDASPVAQGEQSRVALLKSQYAGRQPHKLTEERTGAQLPTGAQKLKDGDGDDGAVSEERSAELLAATPLGQAALEAKSKK